jgi:hypothetical protein
MLKYLFQRGIFEGIYNDEDFIKLQQIDYRTNRLLKSHPKLWINRIDNIKLKSPSSIPHEIQQCLLIQDISTFSNFTPPYPWGPDWKKIKQDNKEIYFHRAKSEQNMSKNWKILPVKKQRIQIMYPVTVGSCKNGGTRPKCYK